MARAIVRRARRAPMHRNGGGVVVERPVAAVARAGGGAAAATLANLNTVRGRPALALRGKRDYDPVRTKMVTFGLVGRPDYWR